MLKRMKITTLIMVILFSLTSAVHATQYYVDPNGSDGANGLSWATAFATVQKAIDVAITDDDVDVNEGTYYETIDFDGNITLRSTNPNDPNVVAATIIDGNDAGTVVTFNSNETADCLLTGFTITGGYATFGGGFYINSTSPTITRCVITNNAATLGGGMYNEISSSPIIKNCVFNENRASVYDVSYDGAGGGMYNSNSSPALTNCLITNCSAYAGGAIYDYNSSPTLINCTIAENEAHWTGGMRNEGTLSKPVVKNCIFWQNHADSGSVEVSNFFGAADPNFSYCDIRGCGGSDNWDPNYGTDGGGNIDSDPKYVDKDDPDGNDNTFMTTDDGLCLDVNSPCINASNNDAVSEPNDIKGDPRIISNIVDMGAYESTYTVHNTTQKIWYNTIQSALDDANADDTIEVYPGTFYETIDFDGNDITLRSTDPNDPYVVAATIIDGNDAGTVVTFDSNETADFLLTGFTITNGYKAALDNGGKGGGIYISSSSPTITNCVITNNNATYGAGIYNESSSSPAIKNCVFSENSVSTYPEYGDPAGGGMYNSSSSPTITSCVFTENMLHTVGGMYNLNSSPTLTNCTFTMNEAHVIGCMRNDGESSKPVVFNCIFWDNFADIGANEINNINSAEPTFANCDIKGCGGSISWDPNYGTDDGGNIDVDPNYANINDPDGTDNIFMNRDDGLIPTEDSGCIDAGDGDEAPEFDITGHPRIDDPNMPNTGRGDPNYTDIGAYEYDPNE